MGGLPSPPPVVNEPHNRALLDLRLPNTATLCFRGVTSLGQGCLTGLKFTSLALTMSDNGGPYPGMDAVLCHSDLRTEQAGAGSHHCCIGPLIKIVSIMLGE